MVFRRYSGTDLMLRNIINELQRIFLVTAMTVSLLFKWLTRYKLFRKDCCAWT